MRAVRRDALAAGIGRSAPPIAGRCTRAYLTGRTFSEYSTWVFVSRTPAGWSVAGTAPLDFFATEEVIPWPE
jgi:hypothetical protein